MIIKKHCGKIYGASFSPAEQKAMDLEIQRQLAVYERKHFKDISAFFMWQLHKHLGFGHKRIDDFYQKFIVDFEEMVSKFEDGENDIWVFEQKLMDYGVELEKRI